MSSATLPKLEEETIEKVQQHPTGLILRQQLEIAVSGINPLRVRLGVSDDQLTQVLGITRGTYNKHKSNGFRTFSCVQVDRILEFLQRREQMSSTFINPRVQNHHKNQFEGDDDFPDDGNNGDYE
ncbi:hypothetical protein [Chroococcidiopsis sp.]|uniref:hypothetical protein n=1 Tax=Chroococcidiopsis sp. TaxID=3088168 RepID=UPI003F351BEE